MDIIIVVIITIAGWITSHLLYIRAQKKIFLNQIKNDARIRIIDSLNQYLERIEQLSIQSSIVEFQIEYNSENDISNFIEKLKTCVNGIQLRLDTVELLEQYESIFPQTIEVRKYLWSKHAELFSKYRSIVSQLSVPDFYDTTVEEVGKNFNGYLLGAQKWVIKDLIICLQNIILSDTTCVKLNKFPEKDYGRFEIRHPRVRYDLKGNIFVTEARYRKESENNNE
jgi:hypothetical protein